MGRAVQALVVVLLLVLLVPIAHADAGIDNTKKLAYLASSMIGIAGSSDYRLECGPTADTLNTPPATGISQTLAPDFCVLEKMDGTTPIIVYGTYGTGASSTTAGNLILQLFKDPRYAAQIKSGDIDQDACNDVVNADKTFVECENAVKGLHVYDFDDSTVSGAHFLLVSEASLTSTSFIDTILDFFGLNNKKVPFIDTTDQFHHAFFARLGSGPTNRSITATWFDQRAVIQYQNLVTNISKITPVDSRFYLGSNNKQVLRMDMSASDTSNVALWKQYTAGVRLQAVTGNPISGDVCGNGVVGFDEQCDGPQTKSCHAIDSAFAATTSASCYPAGSPNNLGCTWNTANCVSCTDLDKDGFSTGQGVSGSLVVINGFSLGTAAPYGNFTAQTNTLEAARTKSFPLTSAIMPVSYDIAFPKGSQAAQVFAGAVANSETRYATCISTKTEAECLADYYKPTEYLTAQQAMLGNVVNFKSARPCVLQVDKMVCPDGYSPRAVGINQSYSIILPQLKARDVSPVIRIVLGTCADASCGPYAHDASATAPWNAQSDLPVRTTSNLAQYSDEELRKITAYCGVVASGFGTYWASLSTNPTTTAFPSTYIVLSDPKAAGMSPETYDTVYRACKVGVESALGTGATVLYSVPPPGSTDAGVFFAKVTGAPTYDGVILSSSIQGGAYVEYTSQAAFDTAMSTTNSLKVPVYSIGTLNPTKDTLFGAQIILQYARHNIPLFYDTLGMRNFSNISGSPTKDTQTNVTRFWLAAMKGMKGTLYDFRKLPPNATVTTPRNLPSNVFVTLGQTDVMKSTITIYNLNGNEVPVALDISACSAQTVTKVTDVRDIVTSASGQTPAAFDGKLPAYSITSIDINHNVTCIVGSGALSRCAGALDCLDKNPNETGVEIKDKDTNIVDPTTVHPGAVEVCGSGVDYNCDGKIGTSPPDCTPQSQITPPTSIKCNYNGTCESTESQTQCWDCIARSLTCPTPIVDAGARGAYKFQVRSNVFSKPELIISLVGTIKVDPGTSDYYVMYGGMRCYLSADRSVQPTGTAITRFLSSDNRVDSIDWDEPSGLVTATRETDENGNGQWRLKTQTGSTQLNKCWASSPTANDGDTFDTTILFSKANPCYLPPGSICTDATWPGLETGLSCQFSQDCCGTLDCKSGNICGTYGGGGGGGGCFIAGTPVKTPNGDRPIETLRIGDEVIAHKDSGDFASKITFVEKKEVSSLIIVTPEGLGPITTTPVHRFFTKRGWVVAGDLLPSDMLLTQNGWTGIVSLQEQESSSPVAVYNLHIIDEAHNFYAGGVLVHNLKPAEQQAY